LGKKYIFANVNMILFFCYWYGVFFTDRHIGIFCRICMWYLPRFVITYKNWFREWRYGVVFVVGGPDQKKLIAVILEKMLYVPKKKRTTVFGLKFLGDSINGTSLYCQVIKKLFETISCIIFKFLGTKLFDWLKIG
jgi:hypothetical protein